MRALIVAFDGLVADTLKLRADAIASTLGTEGIAVALDRIRHALPGRALFETVELLLGPTDPTLADVVVLRAQQHISQRMAQGVALTPNARPWIDAHQSAGARLVLRADSVRRDVERVLQLTDLEPTFTMVRCADDAPRIRNASTLESAYGEITRRLDASRVSTGRTAFELGAYAVGVTQRYVSSVHQSLDSRPPSSITSLPR